MDKFIVWADGRKNEARVIEASGMPEAIDHAASEFGVDQDKINIIDAANSAEAEFYGVGDLVI